MRAIRKKRVYTIATNNTKQGKKEQWQGGITVDTSNDHRMVMLAAIAQLNCKHNLNIRNKDAVQKSYPNFWEDYAMLRGHYEYLE